MKAFYIFLIFFFLFIFVFLCERFVIINDENDCFYFIDLDLLMNHLEMMLKDDSNEI